MAVGDRDVRFAMTGIPLMAMVVRLIAKWNQVGIAIHILVIRLVVIPLQQVMRFVMTEIPPPAHLIMVS